jgi:hypothetical protein
MIGSEQPKVLAEFCEKVVGNPDMVEDGWYHEAGRRFRRQNP